MQHFSRQKTVLAAAVGLALGFALTAPAHAAAAETTTVNCARTVELQERTVPTADVRGYQRFGDHGLVAGAAHLLRQGSQSLVLVSGDRTWAVYTAPPGCRVAWDEAIAIVVDPAGPQRAHLPALTIALVPTGVSACPSCAAPV